MSRGIGHGVGVSWQSGGRIQNPAVASGGRPALLPTDGGGGGGPNPPGPGGGGNKIVEPDWANVILSLPNNLPDGNTIAVDYSDTFHSALAIGTAQQDTAQFKFGTSAMLFDGNSDEFQFTDHAQWDLGGDFTIELWVRFSSVAANQTFIGHYTGTGSQRAWRLHWVQSTNKLIFVVSDNGVLTGGHQIFGEASTQADWIPATNRWYHLAVSRTSNKLGIFIDGDRKVFKNISGVPHNSTDFLRIGSDGTGGDRQFFSGWIDDVRITSGQSVYPKGSFSPPTAAHTVSESAADSDFANVVLLLPFDGVDATTATEDYSNSDHTITFVSGANVDTAQSQFGGSSLRLDGLLDRMTVPDSADWDLGSGLFTIEAWVKIQTLATSTQHTIVAHYLSTGDQSDWIFEVLAADALRFIYTTDGVAATQTTLSGAFTWVEDTWYHLAVDRDVSNNVRLYVNGAVVDTTAAAVTINSGTALLDIGAVNNNSVNELDGWIDELRITPGVARYAGAFTAPTTFFPRHG